VVRRRAALIGASNFFELAVATAIALFGFQSGAAQSRVPMEMIFHGIPMSLFQAEQQ